MVGKQDFERINIQLGENLPIRTKVGESGFNSGDNSRLGCRTPQCPTQKFHSNEDGYNYHQSNEGVPNTLGERCSGWAVGQSVLLLQGVYPARELSMSTYIFGGYAKMPVRGG